MTLTIDIPDNVADSLRTGYGKSLDRIAIEQFALEGYKAGHLSRYQVQQLLGFDNRWDTERWLGGRGACRNYSMEDYAEDAELIDERSAVKQ